MAQFSSLSDLVSAFESGSQTPGSGQIYSTDPRSSAQGKYSFLSGTWRTYAPAAGVDVNQYPTANAAPASVQDQVFAEAVRQRGLGDWTCPGCNPALSNYIAAHPEAMSLPVFDSGSGGGDTLTMAPSSPSLDWGSNVPFNLPGTDNPILDPATGSAPQGEPPGMAQSGIGQSVLPALGANVADLFTRAGLVLLALVLIAAAAWALAHGELGQQKAA